MIPVLIFQSGPIGMPYLQRLWAFDCPTSYYAAMSQGLQDMLAFGEEAGGDVRALSLIHSTCVMLIVTTMPFILQGTWDVDLTNPAGTPTSSITPGQVVLLVAAGLVGWQMAKAVGPFGASIFGLMIAAGVLAITSIFQRRPPADAI